MGIRIAEKSHETRRDHNANHKSLFWLCFNLKCCNIQKRYRVKIRFAVYITTPAIPSCLWLYSAISIFPLDYECNNYDYFGVDFSDMVCRSLLIERAGWYNAKIFWFDLIFNTFFASNICSQSIDLLVILETSLYATQIVVVTIMNHNSGS